MGGTRFCVPVVVLLITGAVYFSNVHSFTSISDKLHDVHFEYPGPAISERDLPICPQHAVCSVLHRRFWDRTIVERLCRCLHRTDCPWVWTNTTDNNTMYLNNRSQLKFCDEVSDLTECSLKKTALTVTTTTTKEKVAMAWDGVQLTTLAPTVQEERKLAVNVSCFCPPTHSWREQPQKGDLLSSENGTTVTTQYRCKPMGKCTTLELCGYMRADYFSTYYHCSCPIGHMCLNQNRTIIVNATELLYSGPAYKAFCYTNPYAATE